MKIYESVTIDISTNEVIDEVSYEYDGPVALCDFGSSSSLASAYSSAAAAQTSADQQGISTLESYLNNALTALSSNANNATSAVTDYSSQGQNYLSDMYNNTSSLLSPYITAGNAALNQYAGLLGLSGYTAVDPTETLRSTPGYKWTMNQGLSAIGSAGASTGQYGSGAMAKGLLNYSQGLADTTYQNYLNNVGNLAYRGQNAATSLGSFGTSTAQSQASLSGNTGNALASIYSGLGNATSNAYTTTGTSIANLYSDIGTSQSEGILGSALSNANSSNSSISTLLGSLGLLGGLAGSSLGSGWLSKLIGSGNIFGSTS
jgi:hypothetical protein